MTLVCLNAERIQRYFEWLFMWSRSRFTLLVYQAIYCLFQLLIKNMLSWLDARTQHAKPTYHTLEPLLAMRHSALELIASRLQSTPSIDSTKYAEELKSHQLQLLESALGENWLQRARLARRFAINVLPLSFYMGTERCYEKLFFIHCRCGQFTTAYTCVLKAESYGSIGAMIEYAKLLWQGNKQEAALDSLNKSLTALASTSTSSDGAPMSLAQSLIMMSPNTENHKPLDRKFILEVCPDFIYLR